MRDAWSRLAAQGARRLQTRLGAQLARPSGLLGSIVGWNMIRANALDNALTLDEVDIQPWDRVLEVGFGPGHAIAQAARLAPEGHVAGVDLSPLMVRIAGWRNRRSIAAGRVELVCGSMDMIPYPDACFDRLFTVNTIYFWPDPRAALAEARRVLRPGALLAIGFGARGRSPTCPRPPARLYGIEDVIELMQAEGFGDIRVAERQKGARIRQCVRGRR